MPTWNTGGCGPREETRGHFKNRILVQGCGGAECQTGGILEYFEDLKRGTNKDIGPKDIFEIASKVFRQLKENMVAPKREMGLKEISGKPEDPGKSLKAKFGLFGVEMIEKEVKPRGNTGRVYLPSGWVGKLVKIIRID